MSKSPKLIDFIYTLRLRGHRDEADYYFYTIPQVVQAKEGVPPEELMMTPVDRAIWLFKKPQDPVGWDITAWGKNLWR